MEKTTNSMTVRKLTELFNDGKIFFDSAIQRTLCWDRDKESLLIHSLIEGYVIPHFFTVKNADVYDIIDGKQRTNTIATYSNNEFELSDSTPDTILKSGEIVELAGKRFNDLPVELQNRINEYLLDFCLLLDISEDEVAEQFFRLNNGKAITNIELSRIRAISMEQIKQAATHDIFSVALTASALKKYANEELIIRTWAVLNVENPSFAAKDIHKLLEETEITDESIIELYYIYDRFVEAHKTIKERGDKTTSKVRAAIAKNILKRTHFISLIPIIKKSLADNITIEAFADWVQLFFSGEKSTSISTDYNETTKAQTTNRDNIEKRHTAILNHYEDYFNVLAAQAV